MALEIFRCEQGTEEWFACRAGLPTASEFATVMASGRGGGESKTRRTYMLKLAGEIVTGQPTEGGFSNPHTDRGHVLEPEARELYAFAHDVDLDQVGFIRNGPKGCSPDALVGANGVVEIKTKLPHLLIDALLRDDFISEHKAQCQGILWVAEREWVDLATYWPGLPLFEKRAYRDDAYIAQMAAAVDQFNDELAEVVAKVRAYGGGNLAKAA